MRRLPIAYIDIEVFAHATEDPNKVVEAVQHALPVSYVDNVVFKRTDLRGHYGNLISLFKTRIKSIEIAKAFLRRIFLRLKKLDKEALLHEFALHSSHGNLYIRLDKQAAYLGEFKLWTADPVRIHIRFRKKKIADIVQICREFGLSL